MFENVLTAATMPPDSEISDPELSPGRVAPGAVARAVLGGGLAGGLATAPMTAFMALAYQYLPLHQRTSVPPKSIAMDLLKRVNVKQHMNRKQRSRTAWLLHVAYGAGAGTVYGITARPLPGPAPIKGVGFGLVVWASSYLGWLPALQVSGRATDEPAERNAVMIAAHVVWGATTGLLASRLAKS